MGEGRGSESLGSGPGPGGTDLSSRLREESWLCASQSAEGQQGQLLLQNPPWGPFQGAAPTLAVNNQTVCTGAAMLVTKILRCFKTCW